MNLKVKTKKKTTTTPKKVVTETSDMRGLLYIVKGTYSKTEPCVSGEDKEKHYIGGYDPDNDNTEEWYRVMDNTTFFTISAGVTLDKALEMVKNTILKYKTRKEYFKMLSKVSSEDYYEVHYLGHAPLTREQKEKKMQKCGCPSASPAQKVLEKLVYDHYGDYYGDLISEAEEEAYEELKGDTLVKRTQKKFKKVSAPHVTLDKEEETITKEVHEKVTPTTLSPRKKGLVKTVKRKTI